jgi:hypothetical protein
MPVLSSNKIFYFKLVGDFLEISVLIGYSVSHFTSGMIFPRIDMYACVIFKFPIS